MRKLMLVFLFLLYLLPSFSQVDFYDTEKVQDIRLFVKEKNWAHVLDSWMVKGDDSSRLLCDVKINDTLIHNAGVRYKGFSSWNLGSRKNPINIDLYYTIDRTNYEGFKKIKLANVIQDPSFVREVLSYKIARKYMPAGRANFANVYINDSLIGLYTNVEAVDKWFIRRRFTYKDNTFFKGEPKVLDYPLGQNANLALTHGNSWPGYTPYYNMESDSGWNRLYKFINVLNTKPDTIDYLLNVDRTLWMHAFNYSLVNLDSYIGYSQNYYLYWDDNERVNPLLWDMNMSFGSFRNSDGSYHFQGLTIDQTKKLDPLSQLHFSITPRPLMTNLFKNDTYKRMYLAHMRTVLDENFTNHEYYDLAQHYQAIIDSYVQQDTNKFYAYSDFLQNIDTTVGGTGTMDIYPGLKDLVESRLAYLNTYPGIRGEPVIDSVKHTPDIPREGEDLWITARVTITSNVYLGYRCISDGIFRRIKMYDDGQHNDNQAGDGVFGIKILTHGKSIQYYIYAENDSTGAFSPPRAEYEYYKIQPLILPGDIVINEIQADGSGNNKSWIEIFNNTGEDFRLHGVHLSDDNSNPGKWQLPDTVMKMRSFLMISSYSAGKSSDLHANFSLSTHGGQVFLRDSTYRIIDSLTYGPVASNKSLGRYPNGLGPFVYMEPTYASVNNVGTTRNYRIIMYPNPARDKIYMEFENQGSPVSVQIFNAKGQVLIDKNTEFANGTVPVMIEEFDISGFKKGLYYGRVLFKDKVLTGKFIVL